MTPDRKRELMLSYVAGVADEQERGLAEAMLAAGDPAVLGALAEAQALLACLPLGLDPVTPDAALRQRLMDRLDEAGQDSDAPSRRVAPGRAAARPTPRAWPWWQMIGSAAAAAVVAVVLTLLSTNDELAFQQREIASMGREIAALEREVRVQHEYLLALERRAGSYVALRETLTAPHLQVIQLAGGEPQPQASGRMLWDGQRGRSYFYAANLQPAEPGKTYQLWYVTPEEEKVSMATFDVGPDGRAALSVDLPENIGTMALAAVTDEPAGGSQQPTGEFQLLGEFEP